MPSTPLPIPAFAKRVIKHLVNWEFGRVKQEVKQLEKRGYTVYYKPITEKDYNTSYFFYTARDIIQEAKNESKGREYSGILLFYPGMSAKEWNAHSLSERHPPIWIDGDMLKWWAAKVNGQTLKNSLLNPTGKNCDNNSMYIMVFYHKRQTKNEKVRNKKRQVRKQRKQVD